MFRSPLVMGIQAACSDAKYRTRYPDGVWSSPGAVLGANAADVAAANGDINDAWQFPAGYFVAAKAPAMLIYPRPDTETNTYARHRWAFYDGVHPMRYEIPIGMRAGSPQYRFTLLSGPTGMSIGRVYGDDKYGILTWTPTATATNVTVSVLVENQDGSAPVTLTWTVSTTASTSHFCFVDSVNGSDSTGNGTITAPYKTLNKVYGTTSGNGVGVAGTSIVMRAGTLPLVGWSHYGVGINSASTPMALIGFPDESVTIDLSGAITGSTSGNGPDAIWSTNGVANSGSDFFAQGFTLTPAVNSANDVRTFSFSLKSDRVTFDKITVPDPVNGALNGDNNSTVMLWNVGAGDSGGHNYFYMSRHSETNRYGGNADAGCVLFTTKNFLIENCSGTTTGSAINFFLKDECVDGTVRYTKGTADAFATAMATGCQGGSGNIEICYCTASTGPTSRIEDGAALVLNLQFVTSNTGQHWIYRNTILGGIQVRGSIVNAVGPFEIDSNIVVVSSGAQVGPYPYGGPPTPTLASNVTQINTECHGLVSDGIIDSSTLLLTGTSRTNYLGKRGAEIYNPA